MLTRTGCELAQELARRQDPGRHGGDGAQTVGPGLDDQLLPELSTDQATYLRWRGSRIEEGDAS